MMRRRPRASGVPRTMLLVSRCAWTLYNFRAGLMRALQARGDSVIGGGAGGDGFETRIEAMGVPFVALPVDKRGINPLGDLRLFWTLYRWYRRTHPAVVHHFTIKPVIYGSIAARLARVPRIINTVTGLGYVFTANSPAWLRRFVTWQYRIALRCAHFTFFQNPDDRQLFIQHRLVASRKTAVVPGSGVDTRRFVPAPSENKTGQDREHTVLMVARVLRDKGVYEFAEAAGLVRREHPGAQFVLLGRRDERNPTVIPQDVLDRWRAEGVVAWLGEVPDVRNIVAGADMVVLPSYREGTPRSLLEAAAMGKPLITTDTVGCREAVDDGVNGFLVPVKNASALAGAIHRLLVDLALRRRMGQAGREKMIREFEESIVLRKIMDVYDT